MRQKNFCCSKPAHGTLLWQLKQTNTISYQPIASSLQGQHSLFCSVMLRLGLWNWYYILPSQLDSYQVLPIQGTRERLEAERRKKGLPVSGFCQHRTSNRTRLGWLQSPASLYTHNTSHPTSPWMCCQLSHTLLVIKMPAAVYSHRPGCTSTEAQPIPFRPLPRFPTFSSFYPFPANFGSYYLWVISAFPFCFFQISNTC